MDSKQGSQVDYNLDGEKLSKSEQCLSKLRLSNSQLIEKQKPNKSTAPARNTRLWTKLKSENCQFTDGNNSRENKQSVVDGVSDNSNVFSQNQIKVENSTDYKSGNC